MNYRTELLRGRDDFKFCILDRGLNKFLRLGRNNRIFLSLTDTLNAAGSLKLDCNIFLVWIHEPQNACMFIRESFQRLLIIWNNFFLGFWIYAKLRQENHWMGSEKAKSIHQDQRVEFKDQDFLCRKFRHYWNHFLWSTA